MPFNPNKLEQYRSTATIDKPSFNPEKLQSYKTSNYSFQKSSISDFKKFAPALVVAKQQGALQKLGMPSINKRYGKGFLGGVVSVIEGTARSMEAFIPAPFVGKNIGKWVADKAKVAREFYQPPDPKFTDAVVSGFGSMTGFILPGIGISKAISAASLAPRMANWIGATASGVFEAMAEGGFAFSRAKEKNMTDKKAVGAATKTFWLNLPTVVFTNKLGIFGDKGGAVRKGLISAPIESIQEWTQQIIGNMAVDDPIFEGALESALVGGIVGGGTGVAMGAFETKVEKVKPSRLPGEIATIEGKPIEIPPKPTPTPTEPLKAPPEPILKGKEGKIEVAIEKEGKKLKWWEYFKKEKIKSLLGDEFDAIPITREEAELIEDTRYITFKEEPEGKSVGGQNIVFKISTRGIADTTGVEGYFIKRGDVSTENATPEQMAETQKAVDLYNKIIREEREYIKAIPQPKGEGEITEAWEMTREEYEKISAKDFFNIKEKYFKERGFWFTKGVIHKFEVKKALSEGKTVPSEVLKDYPGLEKEKIAKPRKAPVYDIEKAVNKGDYKTLIKAGNVKFPAHLAKNFAPEQVKATRRLFLKEGMDIDKRAQELKSQYPNLDIETGDDLWRKAIEQTGQKLIDAETIDYDKEYAKWLADQKEEGLSDEDVRREQGKITKDVEKEVISKSDQEAFEDLDKIEEGAEQIIIPGAEVKFPETKIPPSIPGLGKPIDLGAPTGALRGIDAFEGIPEGSKGVELRLFEEVKKIAKKYANIIGEKYVPRKFLGIKWGDTNNIFVKALNDLSTVIHEVVHYVDVKKGVGKKLMRVKGYAKNGNPIYAPETKKMRKQITEAYMEFYPTAKKTHKLEKRITEGLAVFIENYIAQPTAMKKKYPDLYKEFLVGGEYYDPTLTALVKDAQNLIGAYQKLDSLKKVGAKVLSDDQPVIRDSFLNTREKIIQEIVDNVYPLEKIAVEAGVQWTKEDPSLWTRLYNNISGIISRNINTNKGFTHFKNEELVKLYDFNWKTLIEDLKRGKLTDDFAYWLVARREYFMHQKLEGMKEKVLEVAERLKDLKEQGLLHHVGAKEEVAEAKKVMDDYKNLASIIAKDGFSKQVVTDAYLNYRDQFTKYADQFDKLVRADLDFLYDVGMVKGTDYQDYITEEGYATFKRDIYNEVVGEGREVSGIAKVSKKVSSLKRRGGSELTIINPLYSSIKNHSEIMRKGMKQLIRNKVYNLKSYFPDLMQEIPLSKVPKLGGGFEYPQDRDPNILMAMSNGKRTPVLVSKEIMTVINELLTFKNIHIFERLLVKGARLFTKGTTGLYPPFAIQNFFVDQITASAQTTTKYKPIVSQLNLLYKQLEGHSEVAKFVQEYLMLGGQRHTFVGWLDMNPNEFFTAISKEKNALQKVGDMLDQGFQLIATPVQVSEILTRGVEYANSRMAGEPQIVALERAGRVSAPFHHIGRWGGESAGRTLVKSIPYFNASLQVLAQYSRTIKNPKTRKRATFVLFALNSAIVGGFLSILLAGSDEQKELYKDLHPRELAHYLMFPSPDGKTLLRFRVPEQMSAFATLMNMAMSDVLLGTRYTKQEYIDAATSWVPDQFNVTDPIRVFFAWMPHLLGTTTEVLMNKRTYPKVMPIEGMAMERHEAKFRYNKHTGWLAKYLGNLLNLSPQKIDYLIEGMIGRTSKFVKGGRITNPIVREVYFNSGRRMVEFYELRNANNQKFDSYRNKLREFFQDEIKEMYELKSKIAEISSMLGRYKREEINENNLVIEELRKDILDKVDSLRYTQ